MSVHRAGSYYGVPHSTLEYKVKERHLMRPRKRDPKPNPVDEKIASLKQVNTVHTFRTLIHLYSIFCRMILEIHKINSNQL